MVGILPWSDARCARVLSRACCQYHANLSSENLQFWNNTPEKTEKYSCFSRVLLLRIWSVTPILQILFSYCIGFACSHFLQMFYRSAGIFCACTCWDIQTTRLQTREFSTLYIVHPYPSEESPRREVMRLMARTYRTLAAAGEIWRRAAHSLLLSSSKWRMVMISRSEGES